MIDLTKLSQNLWGQANGTASSAPSPLSSRTGGSQMAEQERWKSMHPGEATPSWFSANPSNTPQGYESEGWWNHVNSANYDKTGKQSANTYSPGPGLAAPSSGWGSGVVGQTTTSGAGGNLASPTTDSGGTDWTAGSYNPFAGDSTYGYITQPWYRNSDWGGGAIWNPTYGWQEVNQIKSKYGGQSATDEQMAGWGLNQNTTGSWEDYASQLGYTPTWDELGGAGGGGGGATGTGSITTGYDGYGYDPGQEPTGTDAYISDTGDYSGVGGFGYQPPEWDMASNVLNTFADTGNPVNTPGQWDAATMGAYDMLANQGMATDTSDWYKQAKSVSDYDTQEAIKQALEQTGLTGNRWSSGAQRQAADIGGKYASQLGAQYAQQTMSAQEAARARQMEAGNQLYNYGTGYAGLDTDARNRALQATGQLGDIGQRKTDYARGLANDAFTQGSALYGQDQAALQNLYKEFMRGTAENNPWLSYAMQMATGQGTQQQYTPGTGSSLLSGLGSILPFLFL